MQEPKDPAEIFREVFDSGGRRAFTTTQAVAIVLFFLTVIFPAFWFVEINFHHVFEHPRLVLCGINSAGTAVGLLLITPKGERLLALIPGVLMGLGCAAMVILLKAQFPNAMRIGEVGELFLLLGLPFGTFPGLFLLIKLQARHRAKIR